MFDNVAVEFCGSYIHVKQPGVFALSSPETKAFWARLKEICDELDSDTVLIEAASVDLGHDTMHTFDSGVNASSIVENPTIAICAEVCEPDDAAEFFKTVAKNRGAHVEFFTSFHHAVSWLGIDSAPSNRTGDALAA